MKELPIETQILNRLSEQYLQIIANDALLEKINGDFLN